MALPQIKMLVTADYELFHGRNFYNDDEVLFKPTSQLLNLCNELKIPLTLFADVCSISAHNKFGLRDFVAKFETQLQTAIKEGHDVQLHIHPHWLVVNRENNEWILKERKIHLSEFGYNESKDGAPQIIKQTAEYLTNLMRKARPDYRCVAYRAGGLALQPDETKLLQSLNNAGIKIDSSIAKGLVVNMDTINIDYSAMPSDSNWYIDSTHGIRGGATKGLWEIPVATFQSGLAQRVAFLARRAKAVGKQRGAGISRELKQTRLANLKTLIMGNMRYLGSNPYFLLSADTKGFSTKMLLDGFQSYVKKHKNSPEIYVSMLNHPKLMFDEQLQIFREFITGLGKIYGHQISFETYNSVVGKKSLN